MIKGVKLGTRRETRDRDSGVVKEFLRVWLGEVSIRFGDVAYITRL